jgi:hypothetical protein
MRRFTAFGLPRTNSGILLGLDEPLFPAEFVEGRQPLSLQRAAPLRSTNRAARLALVAAIPESAILRESLDIRERVREACACIPQLQFAYARSVDQQAACGEQNHLPRGGGVPSFAVRGADVSCALARLTEQRVDERRFPDSRGAQERGSAAAGDFAKLGDAVAAECAGGYNANAERDNL